MKKCCDEPCSAGKSEDQFVIKSNILKTWFCKLFCADKAIKEHMSKLQVSKK